MNDQDGGESKEGQPDKDPPSQSEPRKTHHLGAPARQGRGADHHKNSQGDLSETETQLADRIKRSDLWMISLTAAIVVLTGVNVWVFYRESEGSAKDIREFTVKAGDMVTAVNQSLAEDRTAIKAILKDNRDALAVSERQINSSLTESVNQGRATLLASTSQTQLDQRAWVGFVVDNVTVSGNEIGQGIAVQNTGKTPASNVRMKSQGKLIPRGDEITQPDYKVRWPLGGDDESASAMPPGNLRQIFVPPVKLTPNGVEQIRSGAVVLYQFGLVTYDDAFGHHHRTDFCVYLLPALSRTADCPKFNHQN